MGWRDLAACQGLDTEAFDDTCTWSTINSAKQLCGRCPVKQQCLDWAITNHEPWGVWGGYTTAERVRLVAGASPHFCFACGTSFVGSHCRGCAPPNPTQVDNDAELLARKDQIVDYIEDGLTDAEVANRVSMETLIPVTRNQIRSMRRSWGIKSCASGWHRYTDDGLYDHGNVLMVEATNRGFGDLTQKEQHELYRRWVRGGHSPSAFARLYGVSGTNTRRIRDRVEEEDR